VGRKERKGAWRRWGAAIVLALAAILGLSAASVWWLVAAALADGGGDDGGGSAARSFGARGRARPGPPGGGSRTPCLVSARARAARQCHRRGLLSPRTRPDGAAAARSAAPWRAHPRERHLRRGVDFCPDAHRAGAPSLGGENTHRGRRASVARGDRRERSAGRGAFLPPTPTCSTARRRIASSIAWPIAR